MRLVFSPKEYDLIRDLSNGYGTAKHFVLVTPLTKNMSLSPALVTEQGQQFDLSQGWIHDFSHP